MQHLPKFSHQIFAPQKRIIAFLELLSFFLNLWGPFYMQWNLANLSYIWQQNQRKLLEDFGPKTTFTLSNVCCTNGHTITWIPHMCWNISISFSNPWKILASPYTSGPLLLFLPFMLIMMLVCESFTCQRHFQQNLTPTFSDVKYIWNNSYIWTAVVDQSEEWSSQ